jgi:prepilin-type N-terminal cleavage/methylation domain-containing protein
MKNGFSLLEISIVLTIIALIVGGLVVGRSMIRASEIRSISTDLNNFRISTHLFKDKYYAYPGDFRQATRFWGRADGGADTTQNCATPETDVSASNPKATCNGDGSGVIADGSMSLQNTESYRFWQHLSNAELIEGQYTGVGGPITAPLSWRATQLGINAPAAKIMGSGYWIVRLAINSTCSAPNLWTGTGINEYHTRIVFGKDTIIGPPWDAVYTPAEAASVDTKIDDGMPGKGNMTVFCAGVCSDTTDTMTAKYRSDDVNKTCSTAFILN